MQHLKKDDLKKIKLYVLITQTGFIGSSVYTKQLIVFASPCQGYWISYKCLYSYISRALKSNFSLDAQREDLAKSRY